MYFVHEPVIWAGLSKDNLFHGITWCSLTGNWKTCIRITYSHGWQFDAVHCLGVQPGSKARSSCSSPHRPLLPKYRMLTFLTAWWLGSELKQQEKTNSSAWDFLYPNLENHR